MNKKSGKSNISKVIQKLSRREFIYLSAMAGIGTIAGCAVNPVTGRQELMLMSESQEIQVDRENSPHQISADFGEVQDSGLNNYLSYVGENIARTTHRPDMPYSFHALNAPYVNAYAFPGGTIGITRGILLDLDNEAELASLIGHEAGHVSARHTSQRMTRSLLAAVALSGVSAAAGSDMGDLVSGLGGIGAGALLAGYSRNQEREADSLGLEYMVGADYNPQGFTGLMDMLNEMSGKDESAMAVLFSTHPMSSERYRTAMNEVSGRYKAQKQTNPIYRERYMDNIAGLRRIAPAIKAMQDGDEEMMKENPSRARERYEQSLKVAPDDYAGNLKMAKCHLTLQNIREAQRFTDKARQVYPQEPQAIHVMGMVNIHLKNFEQALSEFNEYEDVLPGNPNTIFFQGLALEGMESREQAAEKYYNYLQQVSQGEYAKHAHSRLQQWGYLQ